MSGTSSTELNFFKKLYYRAHEGYLDQGILVKDSKLLRQNYMKTRQIKIDVLSVFPTDLTYLVFDNKCLEVIFTTLI